MGGRSLVSGCGPGPRSQHSWVAGQGLPARPIRHLWEAPVFVERTSVGLDVHARSIAAAAIDGVTGELFQARLTPSYEHIKSWIGELPGPVAVAYEAGPTGFGLCRGLTAGGGGGGGGGAGQGRRKGGGGGGEPAAGRDRPLPARGGWGGEPRAGPPG